MNFLHQITQYSLLAGSVAVKQYLTAILVYGQWRLERLLLDVHMYDLDMSV
jgi:hypothetical protein